MKRTMMAFQGSWARLDYMRHLRGEGGTYEHWGLERTYGANASQRVMGDVHAEIATQVLQTPIRELLEQLEVSADDLGITPAALGKRLRDKERAVAPQDLRGRSPKHRAAVLLAIQLLTQAASAAGVQEPTSTK